MQWMQRIELPVLIEAYRSGCFPMATSRHAPSVSWYEADPRAILPIEDNDPAGAFHVPRSLAKQIRKNPFEMRVDTAFTQVMTGCAKPRDTGLARRGESETWINPTIIDLFTRAHQAGLAHSVEAWQNGALVGGVYGLALGGAFFAESMFSTVSNASRICLVRLVETLKDQGFTLLDVQMHNPHLEQFGVACLSIEDYHARLAEALERVTPWGMEPKQWPHASGQKRSM